MPHRLHELHPQHHAAIRMRIEARPIEDICDALDSTVTRAVYIQEIKTAERTSRRRARMEAEYSDLLGPATRSA